MIVFVSTQTVVRRMTSHGASEALSAFVDDAGSFIRDHPLLLIVLGALGIIVFWVTQPRIR